VSWITPKDVKILDEHRELCIANEKAKQEYLLAREKDKLRSKELKKFSKSARLTLKDGN